MVTRLPTLAIALLAVQTLAVGSLCYDFYLKYQSQAACQTRLGAAQGTATRLTALEARQSEREAILDATEAQLNGAKPQ